MRQGNASSSQPSGFGSLLRRYRLAAGFTQEALAERAGLSGRAISALESGARNAPHRDTTERLVAALRLPPDERTRLDEAANARRRRRARQAPAAGGHPTNLPLQLTSFVGRERELADVAQALANSRLLTITGVGGCGKTRLALRVAEGLLDHFPDGVWLARLASLADPSLVVKAVATELGVPERSGRSHLDALLDALRARRLLLVLDNCEHLLDASALLADSLLRACPDVTILATSREALGIAGEVVLPETPLALPPAGVPLGGAGLARYDAVALFAERARAARPSFAVADENADAVAIVCRRLDGIPLALELAAARMGALTAEQIAARLDQRFRLLTSGNRAALPRQQTLQATMDWSYALLTEPERALLRRLAAFSGGWTIEAAEAVCPGGRINGDAVLELLTSLVGKSLVVAEPVGAEGRFRLLETVRQFAQDRLQESGERDDVCRRHRDWYLGLVEQAEAQLVGPRQAAWSAMLEREHDNVRAAFRWSMERGDADAAFRICAALWRFWGVRGHFAEGLARAAEVRALVARTTDRPSVAMARAVYTGSFVAYWHGDFRTARTLSEQSLDLAYRAGDRRTEFFALHTLGVIARTRGDYDQSASLLGSALELAPLLDEEFNSYFTHISLMQLGDTERCRGNYDRAASLLGESLVMQARLGDERGAGLTLLSLGNVAHERGDHAAARSFYGQCLEAWRRLGARQGIGQVTACLGLLALDEGDLEEARRRCGESLALFADLGNGLGVACALEGLAGVSATAGHDERATRLAAHAAALRSSLEAPPSPSERSRVERWLAPALARLDGAAAGRARAEGRAMTRDQAIAYALAPGLAAPAGAPLPKGGSPRDVGTGGVAAGGSPRSATGHAS